MLRQFTEFREFADKNRRSAANMRTAITKMADGSTGVTLFWDGFFMSLTREELMKLAGLLVNDIDELDKRNKQPKMPRQRTRSYLETEPHK